jgi:hypothetical protein
MLFFRNQPYFSYGQAFLSNSVSYKKLQPACRTGKLKVLRRHYAPPESLQSGKTAASHQRK